jgi:hypothetical protein
MEFGGQHHAAAVFTRWYPLHKRLIGPQTRSEHFGEETNCRAPTGIRSPDRQAHSIVATVRYPDLPWKSQWARGVGHQFSARKCEFFDTVRVSLSFVRRCHVIQIECSDVFKKKSEFSRQTLIQNSLRQAFDKSRAE